jgi:hypothetical protein
MWSDVCLKLPCVPCHNRISFLAGIAANDYVSVAPAPAALSQQQDSLPEKRSRTGQTCQVCGHTKFEGEFARFHSSGGKHLSTCLNRKECTMCNPSFCTVPEGQRKIVVARKHKKAKET